MFKGEWLFIDEVMKDYAGTKSMRFVEVGANDGVRGDHLNYWIQNFGWTGIMCEPLEYECSLLKQLYVTNPNIHVENVAIHSTLDRVTLYVPNPIKRRGTASIYKNNRNIWRHRKRLEKIKVPCCTVQSLIDKYKMHDFKILQIDAEGAELEVIQSIDLNRNCPDIINYEHKHIRRMGFEKQFLKILKPYGFEHIEYSLRDSVALRRSSVDVEAMKRKLIKKC